MNRVLAPVIAIAAGIIVLLSYFLPGTLLINLRMVLIQWATILAGMAVFVGILNLLSVHLKNIRKGGKGKINSLLLIASMLITLILGLLLGPNSPTMLSIFNAIILPVETSLMAVMAVTLIYAGIRLLRHRNDLMAIIFISTALIVMLGSAPMPFFTLPLVGDFIRPIMVNIFAASGARGILLGVALGILFTGLRVLTGADRPYEGK